MKKILITITAACLIVGSVNAQTDPQHTSHSDTTVNQLKNKSHQDGFMLWNGKMMCVANQKMTLLKNDTTLMNGTTVMREGSYRKKGEAKVRFREGQHMDISGKIILMTNEQVNRLEGGKKIYLVKDTVKNKKY